MSTNTWKILTEEAILNCVERESGLSLRNLCIQRNSYINRVFEVEDQETSRYIVKFYRPGRWTAEMIHDEHRTLNQLSEIDIPVIPPLRFNGSTLFFLEAIPFAIFPKKGGRALDELDQQRWQEVGRLIGRLHHFTSTQKHSSRLDWTPHHATQNHLETILQSNTLPHDYESPFQNAVSAFITSKKQLFSTQNSFLIHGDCHIGNIIFRPDEGLYLVDFDDMVIGPPIQDLWMLLPDDPELCEREITWFEEGYNTFFNSTALNFNLITALKVMRQIHFAAWCALQYNDPSFSHHFPDWGTTTYWNQLIRDIHSV